MIIWLLFLTFLFYLLKVSTSKKAMYHFISCYREMWVVSFMHGTTIMYYDMISHAAILQCLIGREEREHGKASSSMQPKLRRGNQGQTPPVNGSRLYRLSHLAPLSTRINIYGLCVILAKQCKYSR